jgi:hypothetical protein
MDGGGSNKSYQSLAAPSIVEFLPDAVLTCQHPHAGLVHDAYQLLKDEAQVTLHEPDGHGSIHSGEKAEAGCVGDGLLSIL